MKKLILLFLLLNTVHTIAQGKYDIIVDRNGSGHFRNIQQAIDSVRAFDPKGQTTIFIKNGVYKEKLVLESYLINVKLIGESKEKTIINYDDHANINKMGTFKTYTFLIRGNDIVLENLTIENTAAPVAQAVVLFLEGDRIIVRNCCLLGNQDTLYAGGEGSRHYIENCYIEGTTDFIFGPATSWFENCIIHCKRKSYITAANTPKDIPYGFVINNCRITMAEGITSVHLGRPWRPYAMTLFMNCNLPNGIIPEGWHNWGKSENEKTARSIEYNNTGEGANTAERVSWSKQLTPQEAKTYTIANVLAGCDGWNPILLK
ncbi:MAG: hypothetical protein RL662_1287 [Bacteroidota bacterium]|jgi:pectinesterase